MPESVMQCIVLV